MQEAILRTLRLLELQDVTCGKIRIGGDGDGGYVMANDFHDSTIAYSIGVGPQVQWDEEMAARGFHIWQYDHTVEGLPTEHANFHFQKLGIGTDLSDPNLLTLPEMLKRNGHDQKTRMLLKIDVEGCEWDCFDALDDVILGRFDQIVIEYHGLEFLGAESFRARAERVFRKVNGTHRPVHVHANNYAELYVVEGVPIPGVIEVSYARRGRFDFERFSGTLPTPLDTPCDPSRPDIYLGSFRFS